MENDLTLGSLEFLIISCIIFFFFDGWANEQNGAAQGGSNVV